MSNALKRGACALVMLLFALGLCRAALSRFQQKEQAIRQACRDELQKLGISRDAAKAKYPTPEIHMVSTGCIPPGGSGEVVVKGKFAPKTHFIFQNDNIEVVKETQVGGEYRATVKAAPGSGPQTAALIAITPVTGISVRHDRAVVVGGNYEWNLDAANGWKILARSEGKACGTSDGDAYDVQFFRKGESSPFEKRKATLYFSVYEQTNYRFAISQQDAAAQGQAQDMQSVMKKMMDPNLTNAQREELMKSVQKMQVEMQANLTKMTDPSYGKKLQAQRDEFGCERIQLEAHAGSFKGDMRCSDKVGNRIAVTGALKVLGR